MKLELKHLVGYLPYGLMINCDFQDGDILSCKMECLSEDEAFLDGCDWDYKNGSEFKPILHPLSDLTKEIEIGGKKFVPIDVIREIVLNGKISKNQWPMLNFLITDESTDKTNLPYWVIELFYEWHFDIHNLIENNLAIDINTL